jgi:hypothetical protein
MTEIRIWRSARVPAAADRRRRSHGSGAPEGADSEIGTGSAGRLLLRVLDKE